MPVGRRVHQVDAEVSGEAEGDIRVWSTYCGPSGVGGDAGRGLYSRPFEGKKGDREDPDVYGIFSVALKRERVYWLRMSPFPTKQRKMTAFDFIWRPQADKFLNISI